LRDLHLSQPISADGGDVLFRFHEDSFATILTVPKEYANGIK
jgi:hypothetical protein